MKGHARKLDDAQAQRVREWYAKMAALPTAFELARELRIDPSLLYRIGKGIAYKQGTVRG